MSATSAFVRRLEALRLRSERAQAREERALVQKVAELGWSLKVAQAGRVSLPVRKGTTSTGITGDRGTTLPPL